MYSARLPVVHLMPLIGRRELHAPHAVRRMVVSCFIRTNQTQTKCSRSTRSEPVKGGYQVANYSLFDNRSAQAWFNRIGHNALTWVLFPCMALCLLFLSGVWLIQLTRETFWLSVVWGLGLAFLAFVGRSYYIPRGYRRYFYAVFAVPAVLGLLLAIGCIITAVTSGISVLG